MRMMNEPMRVVELCSFVHMYQFNFVIEEKSMNDVNSRFFNNIYLKCDHFIGHTFFVHKESQRLVVYHGF
jgi:hypothetical protein